MNSHNLDKNVLIFSTYASFREGYHTLIKEKLAEKDCTIIGEFSCLGQFTGALRLNLNLNGPLAFIGGKNKGHPDEKDLENARTFANGLLNA